jgi:hypothetical protein
LLAGLLLSVLRGQRRSEGRGLLRSGFEERPPELLEGHPLRGRGLLLLQNLILRSHRLLRRVGNLRLHGLQLLVVLHLLLLEHLGLLLRCLSLLLGGLLRGLHRLQLLAQIAGLPQLCGLLCLLLGHEVLLRRRIDLRLNSGLRLKAHLIEGALESSG